MSDDFAGLKMDALRDLEASTRDSIQNAMKNLEAIQNYRLVPDMSFRMPDLPRIKTALEVHAEHYMEGVQAQARELEQSLKADEELVMMCWHGHEQLRVLFVSMPSENVVALRCVDANGDQTQITGHMSAITFSFTIRKIKPPAKRNRIGFEMPAHAE